MSRVPFVPQMEVVECGAAALAMVLAHHGCHVPLAQLRDACGVSRDGSNAFDIVRVAGELGLKTDAVRATADDLDVLPLPAILHWQHSHFVVLEKVDKRGARILDPASGRVRISRAQLAESFSGIALLFEPTAELQTRKAESSGLMRHARELRDMKGAAFAVIVASLALQLVALLLPLANQFLIDRVIPPRQFTWLWAAAAALGAGVIARGMLAWVRGEFVLRMQANAQSRLMNRFVDHLVRLPVRFFLARRPGDLLQRIASNAVVRDILAGTALTTALDLLQLTAYLALMLAYSRPIGALVMTFAALRLITIWIVRARTQPLMHSELAATAAEGDTLTEAVTAFETLRATGADERVADRWTRRAVERMNWSAARRRVEINGEASLAFFSGASAAALLLAGGAAVAAGQMSIGVFSSFLMLQALLVQPLDSLIAAASQWQLVRNYLLRINDVLDATPETRGGARPKLEGAISVENVSFRYSPRAELVLHDVSVAIRPGEKIALIGPVGQGKSTLARLLLGLYPPAGGAIRFDGRELRELDLSALRRQVGVVAQESFLFNDSIRYNISLNDPSIALERIREAARIACIDDVIERLPLGYDTIVGENGRNLSGGERQRLALARALAHQPAILLLDEATSALDEATERRVHNNLASIGCTRILIAHRMQTIADADRVLVLMQGRIAMQGTYDEIRHGGWLERLRSASDA